MESDSEQNVSQSFSAFLKHHLHSAQRNGGSTLLGPNRFFAGQGFRLYLCACSLDIFHVFFLSLVLFSLLFRLLAYVMK